MTAIVDATAHAPVLFITGAIGWSAMIFLIGVYLLYRGAEQYRLFALLRDTPAERIESISAGRSEVSGRVQGGEGMLRQPFLDRPCVYRDWQIEERIPHSTTWAKRAIGSEGVAFVLDDDTGQVAVSDLSEARQLFSDEFAQTFQLGPGERPPPYVKAFCEHHDLPPTSPRKRRFSQIAVNPGDHLYVFGQARPAKGDDPLPEGCRTIIEPDDDTGHFIVSDRPVEELISRLRNRSVLYSVGALAPLGVGLLGLVVFAATGVGRFVILGLAVAAILLALNYRHVGVLRFSTT